MSKRLYWHRYLGIPYPTGAKKIDRSTKYGNPYKLIENGGEYTREESLRLYEIFLDERLQTGSIDLSKLVGYDLVCSCKPGLRCHGDRLLKRIAELYP